MKERILLAVYFVRKNSRDHVHGRCLATPLGCTLDQLLVCTLDQLIQGALSISFQGARSISLFRVDSRLSQGALSVSLGCTLDQLFLFLYPLLCKKYYEKASKSISICMRWRVFSCFVSFQVKYRKIPLYVRAHQHQEATERVLAGRNEVYNATPCRGGGRNLNLGGGGKN